MHFLLVLLCIVGLVAAKSTTFQGNTEGQNAPWHGAKEVVDSDDANAVLVEAEAKDKLLMRRESRGKQDEDQSMSEPPEVLQSEERLRVLESGGIMALSNPKASYTKLMRRERGKSEKQNITLNASEHDRHLTSDGNKTKPASLQDKGSKDEVEANDSKVQTLWNQFAHDDEQALLELDDSMLMSEMEESLARKNPTPHPTPAPTPKPLPSRSGNCFSSEEEWEGKCYKKCRNFYGDRRRWRGWGNDGFITRIGMSSCADNKNSDYQIGNVFERMSHMVLWACGRYGQGLYGLRIGRGTCAKAGNLSETLNYYSAGPGYSGPASTLPLSYYIVRHKEYKTLHATETSEGTFGWGYTPGTTVCAGFNIRSAHCGYTQKCPAVPRPELANCDELYTDFVHTTYGKGARRRQRRRYHANGALSS